jgi:hypothetical protein
VHNRVTFPDFSAAQKTVADASAAPLAANQATKTGDASAGPLPQPVTSRDGDTRTKRARVTAPPFSWLGVDAWPSFPACADGLP